MKRVRFAFVLLTALFLGPALISAGAAQAAETVPQNQSQAFSQDELKSFAVASLDVQRINDSFQEQLQEAADPDQQMQLMAQAEEQMAEAVENKGLSVDKYNSIVQAARTDEGLARQIIDYRRQTQ